MSAPPLRVAARITHYRSTDGGVGRAAPGVKSSTHRLRDYTMVQIPDSLRSVFSATVEEREGRYVFEVPQGEIDHDAVAPGGTYRVALFASRATSESTGGVSDRPTPERSGGTQRVPDPPVEEGEIREVTIETVGDQGDGIAKVERSFVVIVPGAIPGDEPIVEIAEVRPNVAFASIIDHDPRTL